MTEEVAHEIPSDLRRGFVAVAPLVAGLLGLSLWAQLAMFSFRDELATDTGPFRVLLYLIPFGALGAGFWLRSSALLLAVFPLSLLPPAVMITNGGGASFGGAWGAAQACATMALYLALVSNWLGTRGGEGRVEADLPLEKRAVGQPRAGEYRAFVYPRIVPLLLLWAVPTYAIFWDPAIAATVAQNHPERPEIAQIFMAMIVFFGWGIVAYMSFVVPSLNLEYDVRRLERDVEKVAELGEPSRVTRRIGISAVIAVSVTFIILIIV